MSILWHIMFWVVLPVSMYAVMWAHDRYSEDDR